MRPETQKQIVKAFAMMYDDSDIPLEELINKLQHLNGEKKDNSKKERPQRSKITDKQILAVFTPGNTLRTGQILKSLGLIEKDRIAYQMLRLVDQKKLNKIKINSKLCEYSLV